MAMKFSFIKNSYGPTNPQNLFLKNWDINDILVLSVPYNDFNICIYHDMRVCMLSCVWLFATPWTVACQAPLSNEFSRQDYWSGLPFPPPWDLLHPGIEPARLASPALAGGFFTTAPPGKARKSWHDHHNNLGNIQDTSIVSRILSFRIWVQPGRKTV